MPHFRRLLTLAAALLLAGCASRPAKVQIVEIPGPTRYVEVPAKYTREQPIEQPRNASPLEAPRVAKARGEALQLCNADLARIRALQGTPPKVGNPTSP